MTRRPLLGESGGRGREFGGVCERGEVIAALEGDFSGFWQPCGELCHVLGEPRLGLGTAHQQSRSRDACSLGLVELPGAHRWQLIGEEVRRLTLSLRDTGLAQAVQEHRAVVLASDAPKEDVEGSRDVSLARRAQCRPKVCARVRLTDRAGWLGGLEQNEPRDQIRMVKRQLQPDAAAGGVTDPVRTTHAQLAEQLAALPKRGPRRLAGSVGGALRP